MISKKRLVKTFLSLVKMNSVSRKEGRVVKHLSKELKKLGLKTKIDNAGSKIKGETGNLIAFLKGSVKGAKTLMLNAHVDTVSSGINIKPRIKNDLITSNGKTILGADDKAGVAVILEVLKVIKEDKLPHGDIQVVFTVAEEIGLLGAKALPKGILKADLGFALDGGAPDIILNKAPSQDNLHAIIIGKAAHAGVHPEHGINAIKVASKAIADMKLGRIDKETTANIGIIKGGVATNIIPDRVEIKGEARSLDLRKLKRQIGHMKKALKKTCSDHKARVKLKIASEYRSFYVPEGHRALKLVKMAAKRIKIKPKIRSTGGGSDANIFNKLRIPTVILGTGASRVHTNKERLKISGAIKSAKLLLETISLISRRKV